MDYLQSDSALKGKKTVICVCSIFCARKIAVW